MLDGETLEKVTNANNPADFIDEPVEDADGTNQNYGETFNNKKPLPSIG